VQGEVGDNDELTTAHDMFVEAVAAGRRAVTSGNTDCESAAAQLAELERSVQH
jgi:hypothetical protein